MSKLVAMLEEGKAKLNDSRMRKKLLKWATIAVLVLIPILTIHAKISKAKRDAKRVIHHTSNHLADVANEIVRDVGTKVNEQPAIDGKPKKEVPVPQPTTQTQKPSSVATPSAAPTTLASTETRHQSKQSPSLRYVSISDHMVDLEDVQTYFQDESMTGLAKSKIEARFQEKALPIGRGRFVFWTIPDGVVFSVGRIGDHVDEDPNSIFVGVSVVHNERSWEYRYVANQANQDRYNGAPYANSPWKSQTDDSYNSLGNRYFPKRRKRENLLRFQLAVHRSSAEEDLLTWNCANGFHTFVVSKGWLAALNVEQRRRPLDEEYMLFRSEEEVLAIANGLSSCKRIHTESIPPRNPLDSIFRELREVGNGDLSGLATVLSKAKGLVPSPVAKDHFDKAIGSPELKALPEFKTLLEASGGTDRAAYQRALDVVVRALENFNDQCRRSSANSDHAFRMYSIDESMAFAVKNEFKDDNRFRKRTLFGRLWEAAYETRQLKDGYRAMFQALPDGIEFKVTDVKPYLLAPRP